MNYREICSEVCEIAMEAGDFIAQSRLNFNREKVKYKGPNNLVSHVDMEAEKMIIDRLHKLLPEAEILGEESSEQNEDEKNGTQELDAKSRKPQKKKWSESENYRWIIDPLDGTINFVHGMPPFSVSIALVRGREVLIGVVYEITGDECFYAWKDSPAHLNGREISVSDEPEVRNSLVMTGMAYTPEQDRSELNRLFDYFNVNAHGTRRLGSAAANLAYVASGRGEAFFQTGLAPWDVAAGALIVERAGGVVTEYSGEGNHIYGDSILATNGKVHGEIRKIVQV